jgi:molybdopterin molybdotransferase
MNGSGGEPPNRPVDPRMRGFKTRTSVAELLEWIDCRFRPLDAEDVPLSEAAGRVLAVDITAPAPVPPFARSAMDGYALRAEETYGASAYSPAVFRCVGRSRVGEPCDAAVGPGETAVIATGAPLPEGTNGVVPVELASVTGEMVSISEAIPIGRHVSKKGEDIAEGTVVIAAGRRLRPHDLGIVSAVGKGSVSVRRRPRVTVIVTGNELLRAGTPARAFQIPDVNSVMLEALVARDGGTSAAVGPLPDVEVTIRAAIVAAEHRSDVILISGGSSAGPEDFIPEIIASLGQLVAHGVALRPASPTGVGLIGGGSLPVLLLPGNPVSCVCAYDFFAGPIIRRMGGRSTGWPYRSVRLPLRRKLSSAVGRVDYCRVQIRRGQVEPISVSGASILSSISRADGFVVIPAAREGYPAGAIVEVWCYDETANEAVPGHDEARELGLPEPGQSTRSAHQMPLG